MAKKSIESVEDGDEIIRVRAIEMGYLNHRRWRRGSVLDVPKKLFSELWMEKVGKNVPLCSVPMPVFGGKEAREATMISEDARDMFSSSNIESPDVL